MLRRVLIALALLVLVVAPLAIALPGCPRLPEPDGCTPSATECFDTVENASPAQRTPRVCSQTQRQTFVELGGAPCGNFGAGVVCCRTQGRRGRPVHACVPSTACIADDAQGGALSTPAELARKRTRSFDEVVPPIGTLLRYVGAGRLLGQ